MAIPRIIMQVLDEDGNPVDVTTDMLEGNAEESEE